MSDKPTFEKDLEKLEGIVEALEEGGLSLDEALKRFEEGIKLAKRCEKALTDAEKKIEQLTKNAEGELEAQPFEPADAPEEPGAPERPANPGGKAPDANAGKDSAGGSGQNEEDLLF